MEEHYHTLADATPRPDLAPKSSGNLRAFVFGVAVTLIVVLLALAFDNAMARADHAAACARIMEGM